MTGNLLSLTLFKAPEYCHVHPHSMQGELRLVNGNDGTEYMFLLKGVAEKPLAQDVISMSLLCFSQESEYLSCTYL